MIDDAKLETFVDRVLTMKRDCGLRDCVVEQIQRRHEKTKVLRTVERPKLSPHQADALRFMAARGGWSFAAIRTYAKHPVGTTTRSYLGRCGYLSYVSWDEGWKVTDCGSARAAELEAKTCAEVGTPAWVADLVR